MKSKQLPKRTAAQHASSRVNLSEMLRAARRTSAYAFVAGLGIWLPKAHAAPSIELDATGLAGGPLTNWVNTGTLVGNFNVPTNATVPNVVTNDGVRGVRLLGAGGADTGTHYVGPGTPPELAGANPRTVEAWVYDINPQDEKIIIAWGKRGGTAPDGADYPVGIGTHNTWGAVAAWGTPDIGWNDLEVHGRWTYVVATYDGTTTRIYSEGALANSEVIGINTVQLSTGATPLPFRIGRQNNEAGGIDATGQGDLVIGRVRVHTTALSDVAIAAQFDAEKGFFGLNDDDGDGLPTWYEKRCGLDPNDATGVNGAAGDKDGDGLTNLQEYNLLTRADLTDTDGDGLSDFAEVNRVDAGLPAPPSGAVAATNPLNPDTDGDGLKDGVETDTGIFVSALNTGSDPLVADTDGDTFADGLEVSQGSSPVNAADVPSPNPRIELIATNLPLGSISFWTNSGNFQNGFAFACQTGNGAAASSVNVQTVAGVKAIRLPGPATGAAGTSGPFFTGPTNPAAANLTGNPVFSIEAWVYNESPSVGEEVIFAWGRRGADGLNSVFGHGNSGDFGAMGHWGARDLGWNGYLQMDRWTHLVYTYDAATLTQKAYADGQERNTEVIGALAIADVGTAGPAPFRVGGQNQAGGPVSGVGRAQGLSIGELRLYTRVLSPTEIVNKYTAGGGLYGIFDTDGDGIPSWWERKYSAFMNENNPADGALDQDNDGLSNAGEFANNTDPTNPDTDGDGITDGAEVANGTNPTNADTDLDGLPDGREAALTTTAGGNDSDGDGFSDAHEVLYGSDPKNIASVPNTNTPLPFVSLDATSLPLGPVSVWTNNNALGWKFTAPPSVTPSVAVVDGTKGIQFWGTNHYVGPNMPSYFGGAAARTVEAWIYNPAIANEECIISWGRRGGPDGTLSTFIHGLSTGFGAVGYWGGPDLAWGTNAAQVASNTVAGKWTFVAYTAGNDGVNEVRACYKDGVFANSESTTNLATLNTFLYDPLDPLNGASGNFGRSLPIRIAAQNAADGSADATSSPTTMTIAKVRVYDVALTAAQIAADYNAERVQFPGQPRITNVKVQPNGFVSFDWVPSPGRTYEVQRSADFTNPNAWEVIASGQTSGSITNNPGGVNRAYRLRIEPVP